MALSNDDQHLLQALVSQLSSAVQSVFYVALRGEWTTIGRRELAESLEALAARVRRSIKET